MNLVTHCASCKKDIKVKSSATTRSELQMEKGDEITVNCQYCGNFEKKHINKVIAKPNNNIILVGVGIGVIATIILWIYFGAIGTASIVIPLLFWQQQVMATFNSYMIRRK